jgi:Glycoside hydrolase family 44
LKKKLLLILAALVLSLGVAAFALHRRSAARALALEANEPAPLPARVAGPIQIEEVVYDGKLAPGWEDWGWGQHKLDTGPAQIVFGGFGGITLHHDELPARFGGLSFRFKAPFKRRDFLTVQLKRTGGSESPRIKVDERHLVALPNDWHEVLIDWRELDPTRQPFDRIVIAAAGVVSSEWVSLDNIVLTAPSGGAAEGVATRSDALTVLCKGASHSINPMIYGSSSEDWSSGQSARRIGGNTLTRTNWELGTWNTGSDWYFRNVRAQGNVFDWIQSEAAAKRTTALVVPLLGWVAKDDKSVGFPRSKFGEQRKFDPDVPEAGDGYSKSGKPLVPGPPTQTSVPAPPEVVRGWIERLVSADKARGSRGVHMYILDNEPSLWNETHRDVHPEPLTYDGLLDRTVRYATAIRDADPDAVIAGPAEWGWTGYMYSAEDRDAGWMLRPDRRRHGDLPLVTWYLQQLARHEKRTGKRLLDVLDLHFYPTPEGIFGPDARTDPESSELRIRSTRSLWDSTYKDESWVADVIRLIPRMHEWVAANYPGRKLSLGEWSFGAEDHISGGIATAEALGRFGQHRLDAAFYWGTPKTGSPTFWAFRAYRNFDGQGGRFLDTSLATRETDRVSLFASRDEVGGRLVLVLVNRDPTRLSKAAVQLQGCRAGSRVRMFGYHAGEGGLIESDRAKITADGVAADLPPYGFAVLEVELQATDGPP